MIKRNLRSAFVAGATLVALAACSSTDTDTVSTTKNEFNGPKNIIMVVADGMGPAYTTAYRNYVDDSKTPIVETVVFDDLLVGKMEF